MPKVQKLLSLLQKLKKSWLDLTKLQLGSICVPSSVLKVLVLKKNPNVANRVVSNFLRSLAGPVQVKEANISLFFS